MPRALHFLAAAALLVALAAAATGEHRPRAEPNAWFLDLVIADQQHDSHDHSGAVARRENHTCCHRMPFDEDPLARTLLQHVQVPYNHWWRPAATLISSVAPELDAPSDRLLSIGEYGLTLDFRQHSRLYVRLQCAFPCCLEAAEIIIPGAAEHLSVAAGNATYTVESWRLDREALVPKGYRLLDGLGQRRSRHEAMWRHAGERDRLRGLKLCDYSAEGLWIRVDSPSRIEAALAEIDVCFVHHNMALGWETDLCEEI